MLKELIRILENWITKDDSDEFLKGYDLGLSVAVDEAKKLIDFENVTVETVCDGYYANAQWESKEEEQRTKETFSSAYRLALRHLEGKVIKESTITRFEVINHAKNDRQIGRLLTLHKSLDDFNTLELQLQDGGKTMKIFLD
jgi:hypothetical protein